MGDRSIDQRAKITHTLVQPLNVLSGDPISPKDLAIQIKRAAILARDALSERGTAQGVNFRSVDGSGICMVITWSDDEPKPEGL